MSENTQTAPLANTPTGYGWCAWHQGNARGVRLVAVAEQGSGPGTAGRHFACRPCREAYDLVPLADRP
ncbi:hypothetical protein [Streptomyces caeruleatus]|uniref:Uncharacterized protein n=1 Tax=Streptomyces caeruleatus TaxID=661399 RepID=A0A101TN81_9ACTN|nr:hypothetical protein [Streptomyces caeruleatus]KUN95393.1 hypothetical protein AQJ67_35985 [Streptomyces caeruleatus]